MKTFLKQIFSEDNGNYSSTRVMFIMWSGLTLLIWASLSIYKHEILSLPETIVGVIVALGGTKVLQKFGEKNP